MQREAGKALRLLHNAQTALPWTDLATVKIKEFDCLKSSAAGLLGPRELTLEDATGSSECTCLVHGAVADIRSS
ncbi:MAG: hypothetical protein ACLQFR_10505 [Streptosporangiaceae bacterium]